MTKKMQGIVEKIDNRFETALEVNNSCRALKYESMLYKFNDIQNDAFNMLRGMLYFGLISNSDFEEAWGHVIDLGPKYDYHL